MGNNYFAIILVAAVGSAAAAKCRGEQRKTLLFFYVSKYP